MSLRDFKARQDLYQYLDNKHCDILNFSSQEICCDIPYDRRVFSFQIPKKNGGVRNIQAPNSLIKLISYDILELLEKDYRPPKTVYGFIKGSKKGTVGNALNHVGRRWVLNFDLENFFPSIHFGRIRGRLMARPYCYQKDVAELIAHLACYQTFSFEKGRRSISGTLMTGSPLSPIISNIVCGTLDRDLTKLAKDSGGLYTRYADDITISFDHNSVPGSFGKLQGSDLSNKIELSTLLKETVRNNGFEINSGKTRINHRSTRQEVTGLTVNKKVNVKRNYVRQIRSMLHSWEQYGLEEAKKTFSEKSSTNLLWNKSSSFEDHVKGKIEFLKSVRGEDDAIYAKFANRYNKLYKKNHFKIPVTNPLELLKETVFYIENEDDGGKTGTCFHIGGNYFLTCAHCLGSNLSIRPKAYSNFNYSLDVIDQDNINDIAILYCPFPLNSQHKIDFKEPFLKHSDIDYQSVVHLGGFPGNKAPNEINFREEKIIGYDLRILEGFSDERANSYEVSGGVKPGMSGGPLLFKNQLVGILTRGPQTENDDTPSLAVFSKYAYALIRRNPNVYETCIVGSK